jgi:putative sigma-54 modulation protein
MIQKLEITGVHADVDEKLRGYVVKKLGRLDRYASRQVRKSLHLEIRLKESKTKTRKQFTCEAILHLPHEILRVQETTLNLYAATDIVEEKLKTRLKKYKDLHGNVHIHRRIVRHLRGHAD